MEIDKKERITAMLEKILLAEIINYVKTQKGIDNVKQIVDNTDYELEEQ